MNTVGLDYGFRLVVRKLLIDRVTVEVAQAFADEGIETLVLKGPVLAAWLYPDEIRTYCDSDLMVAPEHRLRAVRALERLGFAEYRSWMPSPLSLDPGGTAYQRGDDMVDLHCVLPGLEGNPEAIWASVLASSTRQVIGGIELRVPDRDTVLLHVGLHAAHHANYVECKPFEDLRRAIAQAEQSQWRRALELARAYKGVPAFAAGLALVPEGRDLARRLDLDGVRSFRHGLRRRDDVIAEEISALLSSEIGVMHKLITVASEIFPKSQYMLWWSPLARRGRFGLALAYLWRPIWAIGQAVRATFTLWRVRRETGESDERYGVESP
jgi:hypothetical protein